MNHHSPDYFVISLKKLIDSDKRTEIRLNANGGNSILIVCPPDQEKLFIESLNLNLEPSVFEIINLDTLLLDFVDSNKEELPMLFDLLRGSLHQVFKSPQGEDNNDLFHEIIAKIQMAISKNRIPVLIRVGALYGTGIDNIHIMENPAVMNSPLPLIILYPATIEGENLMFLSKRPASKYRCMIIKAF